MELNRNKLNNGLKRPVCPCGTEMTLTEFGGYYTSFVYWSCENIKCKVLNDFAPDIETSDI